MCSPLAFPAHIERDETAGISWFLSQLPRELEEAAIIDGAGFVRIFARAATDSRPIDLPKRFNSPLLGGVNVAMIRSSVLLPAPLAPTIAK